jgi:hypothetical protein
VQEMPLGILCELAISGLIPMESGPSSATFKQEGLEGPSG